MFLRIDTTHQKLIKVGLKRLPDKSSGGDIEDELSGENEYGSQVLLPLIEKLLVKQIQTRLHPQGVGSIWDQLERIEVETGLGSFTGLRVGVAIANALGYALGIPVNGKRVDRLEIVEPQYE